MKETWVLFPSADPQRGYNAAAKWARQGYRVGLFLDKPTTGKVDFTMVGEYTGYWRAANKLARAVFERHQPDAVVYAADDIDPEASHTADDITRMYLERFPDGFGMMQPCGDKQGYAIGRDGKPTWNSMRIMGSPWFGRGWMERAYGGRFPTPEFYRQMWGDEELFNVTELLGVRWMNEDLTQDHHHWSFRRQPITNYQRANQKHCRPDHEIFKKRQAEGWPGHEPLKEEK